MASVADRLPAARGAAHRRQRAARAHARDVHRAEQRGRILAKVPHVAAGPDRADVVDHLLAEKVKLWRVIDELKDEVLRLRSLVIEKPVQQQPPKKEHTAGPKQSGGKGLTEAPALDDFQSDRQRLQRRVATAGEAETSSHCDFTSFEVDIPKPSGPMGWGFSTVDAARKLVVESVYAGGAVASFNQLNPLKAIKVKDVLIEMGGRPLESIALYDQLMRGAPTGTPLRFKVRRAVL